MESPSKIMSVNRLDVFTKTPLAYAWANGFDDSWGLHIYKRYMLATRPPKGFSEDGLKNSLEDYILSFRMVFDSIRARGFDSKLGSIPSTDRGITNGAHRLAAALVLGENVVREGTSEPNHNYGYKFMQSIGFPENLIEAAVLEYLNYAEQVTVFCAMGIPSTLAANIQSSLNSSGFSTLYVKAIKLSKVGQRRLMKVLYGANEWWTTDFYESLAIERFSNQDSSYFFFVISKSAEDQISFKSEIRLKYFNRHTFKKFHSSDNNLETIRIAESLLNSNSLAVLNEAPIGSEYRLITMIKEHKYLKSISPRNFAIDGSANLEILGIRNAKDLDYIEIEKKYRELPSNSLSHNLEYQNLPIDPSRLILDPRNYFNLEGYKFVSIAQTISFKAHRGEDKDLSDIEYLCKRNISGSIYGDEKSRRDVIYMRFRMHLRKRINRIITPWPSVVQKVIRRSYVQLRHLLKRFLTRH